jgi:hypothetical protein
MLRSSYESVIRVSRECHTGFTRVLQGCDKGVTEARPQGIVCSHRDGDARVVFNILLEDDLVLRRCYDGVPGML